MPITIVYYQIFVLKTTIAKHSIKQPVSVVNVLMDTFSIGIYKTNKNKVLPKKHISFILILFVTNVKSQIVNNVVQQIHAIHVKLIINGLKVPPLLQDHANQFQITVQPIAQHVVKTEKHVQPINANPTLTINQPLQIVMHAPVEHLPITKLNVMHALIKLHVPHVLSDIMWIMAVPLVVYKVTVFNVIVKQIVLYAKTLMQLFQEHAKLALQIVKHVPFLVHVVHVQTVTSYILMANVMKLLQDVLRVRTPY